MDEGGKDRQAPWRPDKTFYLSNQRSNEIRAACIPGIQALNKLLSDPAVINDRAIQSTLYSDLEVVNGRLIELGITPGMHVGEPLSAFQSNSVTAAEFLAGQLISLTGRTIPTEKGTTPIIKEFSEGSIGNATLVKGGVLPDKGVEFLTTRGVVAFIEDGFDIPQKDETDKTGPQD